MSGWIALLLLILGGFSGYAATGNQPLTAQTLDGVIAASTEAASCSAPVSKEDTNAAIAVGGAVFDPALWSEPSTHKIYPYETTVTWLSDRYGAVAFLEYVHYDCGATPDIDQWGTPDRFVTVFENFSSYEQTASCQADGIRLFEFSVVTTYGSNDHSLYWVKQISPTQIATFNLILPDSLRAKQIRYAQRLFPELPSCAQ